MVLVRHLFANLAKFLRDLFAGPGNGYWDLGRILSCLSLLSVLAMQAWAGIRGQQFDIMAFGGAIAAVLTSAAALIAAKDFSNPANRKASVAVAGDLKAENVENVEMST